MSNFLGLLMILIWGLAYMACLQKISSKRKMACLAYFALEIYLWLWFGGLWLFNQIVFQTYSEQNKPWQDCFMTMYGAQ